MAADPLGADGDFLSAPPELHNQRPPRGVPPTLRKVYAASTRGEAGVRGVRPSVAATVDERAQAATSPGSWSARGYDAAARRKTG
jgi:hypothetical protein